MPASRRWLAPGLGFAGGAALAAGLLLAWGEARPTGAQAAPAAASAEIAPILARLDRIEAALQPLAEETARVAALAESAAQRAALAGPAGERFLAAALLLQSSIATPRPWLREYQAMADLAPPGAVPRPLAEVLGSHAARGLPTEAELRERFAALAPQFVARAPRQEGMVGSTLGLIRGAVASIGLTAPPPPSEAEVAIAGVGHQLRRGNLAGAVADASALDPALQPVLAGWLAQARARLAVEQAVQEVLLRALARPDRPT